MEALLALFIPIVLLWFGMALVRGRPPTPEVVLRIVNKQIARGLRWLWKDRPDRGGSGRPRRPPNRYRR